MPEPRPLPPRAAKKAAAKKAPAKAPAKKAARAPMKRLAPPPPADPPPVEEPDIDPVDVEDPTVAPAPELPAPPDAALEAQCDAIVGEVIDPPYEAWKLRRAGKSWREIAEATGYGDEIAACSAVRIMLRRAAIEDAAELRAEALAVSVARREEIISAFYGAALLGDVAAAMMVEKEQSALDRLYRFGERDGDAADTGRAVVIAGSPEDYVRALQQVVAGPNRQLPAARNEVIDG